MPSLARHTCKKCQRKRYRHFLSAVPSPTKTGYRYICSDASDCSKNVYKLGLSHTKNALASCPKK